MSVYIAGALFALIATVAVLLYLLSRAKDELRAARQLASRAKARQARINTALAAAEKRYNELVSVQREVFTPLAESAELITHQMHALIQSVKHPELEPAGQHAYHHALPGNLPRYISDDER